MKTKLAASILALALIVAGGVYSFATETSRLAGLPIAVGGLLAVIYSRPLAELNASLVERSLIPLTGKSVRPFTVVLWGIGIIIVGLSWMILG